MEKVGSMVYDEMDPRYSFGGLIHNNPLHANLQLIVFQEGTNLFQRV
jgi:hypothetical protein